MGAIRLAAIDPVTGVPSADGTRRESASEILRSRADQGSRVHRCWSAPRNPVPSGGSAPPCQLRALAHEAALDQRFARQPLHQPRRVADVYLRPRRQVRDGKRRWKSQRARTIRAALLAERAARLSLGRWILLSALGLDVQSGTREDQPNVPGQIEKVEVLCAKTLTVFCGSRRARLRAQDPRNSDRAEL